MQADDNEAAETFAAYLARDFMAREGFQDFIAPEAEALASHFSYILTRSDGMAFDMLCFIDGEANPGRPFTLTADLVRQVGQECLQYTGSVRGTKLPMTIRIFDIGAGQAAERQARWKAYSSGFFAKVRMTAWVIDTAGRTVWSNAAFGGRLAGRSRFERLLREPRVPAAELQPPPPAAVAPDSFPFVTYGLLAVLAAVFACELLFGLGAFTGLLEPSIATLEAMGGLTRTAVLADGERFRLLTAAFLHADAMHLALNGAVLFFAGRALEQIVGHAWFAAIYAISAVCGALMSLALLAPQIVSVGASGAITGILGAMLAISFRFPKGAMRTQLQMLALQILIPALLPLVPATGKAIDFGAHLGGALGGLAVGAGMAAIWSRQSPLPRLRWAAAAIALTWIAAATYAIAPAAAAYAQVRELRSLEAQLIPNSEVPTDHATTLASAEALLKRYPRDPRARLYRAQAYLDKNDSASAEKELRAALKEDLILRSFFNPDFERALRATLAAVLLDSGKEEEARKEVQPGCGKTSEDSANIRAVFDKLCQ